MASSHQCHAQDQWALYLCILHRGLFSPIPYNMRSWTTVSVYTTPWSLLTNSIHETMDHYICLYNIMVSSHQSHTWDQGPLCLSIQHHGFFSPIPYMRPVTTLTVYTTSWSLLTNPIHENRDHSICLSNTMVSSHQSHTWEQGPLYLSIQHHGLFSPIPYMRTGTTLSVYKTPWSLLTNYIHETRDHSICLYNTMVSSHQSHTWEQGPLYLSIQHHGLFSQILYMKPGTTISVYTTSWSLLTNPIHENRDHSICLYNTVISSHQSHTWEQGSIYLSIQPHGLFSPTLFMRPWTTLSLYTTSWSLLTNPIHETRDHSISLYNTMVSSHQSHTWDQWPLYLSIQHDGLFSPIPYMRTGTTLSVYTTPWSLLTNPIHENRDHSICLVNTMVSSHQFYSWDQGPLYLPIQHHGLFSPITYMRTGTTLSVYATPWSLLTNSMHEIRNHSISLYNIKVSSHKLYAWDQEPLYLSIQHHGLFLPIPYMRTGATLSVYTTPWSLLTNSIHQTMDHSICLCNIMISSHQSHTIHETRDHSICLCNTMVSSHQSHTWDQWPFYLSIKHHGLFSPTLFMRPWTTLSVYTTSWSLLTNPIHETRDHSICLYNTMVSSHQLYSWDHGPLYLSIQHHGLFSPILYMRKGTTLSIQHHGLFSPILFIRPGTTLSVYATPWSLLTNPIHENRDHSVYTTPWSLLTNSIHETRDHSICLCNIMVSSHQSHRWEQGPLYLSIQHHGLFSPTLFMRPWTTLCLYNIMVSSNQSPTWDQGPLCLSIQHHGLFSPIPYMRTGTTLSVYTTPRVWKWVQVPEGDNFSEGSAEWRKYTM